MLLDVSSGIAEILERARAGLRRLGPHETLAAQAAGAVVVDIRPVEQRRRFGDFPGAVVIDRNVLEWRLDPASGSCLPFASRDLAVIIVCQQGYSSSLAAATLQEIGLHRATDMTGGFEAYLDHIRSGVCGS